MEFELYLDESGNTHADWFNNDQPYFIYGGWLINSKKKDQIRKYISRHKIRKNNIAELKSKILKNDNNYKEFIFIFHQMINVYKAIPFFGIVNKKFLIASKIIDTFFDPNYNKSLNSSILYSKLDSPTELKKELASYILLNDNDNILYDFSNLIKSKECTNTDNIILIKEKLIKLFRSELSSISDSISSIDDEGLMEIQDEFDDNGTIKFLNSIMTPTINSIFSYVSKYLYSDNESDPDLSIYYDKLYGYDELFNYIKSIWNIGKHSKIKVDKNTDIEWGFKKLNNFEAIDSKNEILIQLADLLCGYVSITYSKIINNIVDENVKEFAKFIVMNLKLYIHLNEDIITFNKLLNVVGFNSKNHLDINNISKKFKFFLKK